jgi:hypothetical protein
MADEKKTLEMRVAELEDKLAQVHISEDEMNTYHKVAAKLGAAAPCAQAAGGPAVQSCVAAQQCIAQQQCIVQQCIAQHCVIQHCIQYCIIQQCIIRCIKPIIWNDCVGPCAPGSCAVGGGGGGFGGLGG